MSDGSFNYFGGNGMVKDDSRDIPTTGKLDLGAMAKGCQGNGQVYHHIRMPRCNGWSLMMLGYQCAMIPLSLMRSAIWMPHMFGSTSPASYVLMSDAEGGARWRNAIKGT